MDLGLKDKRFLVTGSTAGIGLATVCLLAAEGADVVLNGRTAQRVEAALAKVRETVPGARVSGVAADLGTAEGCASLIEQVPEVDGLVNNLGFFNMKPFEQVRDEEWAHMFETNVLSGVRLSRHYLAGMRSHGWGRIVFVSSESALQVPTDMIHYSMTKTAQLSIARGLAQMLAGTGVTVNSVLPGPTASESVGAFVSKMAAARQLSFEEVQVDFLQQMGSSSLLERLATTEEVAAMITYVCSTQASATTGSALRVDGGTLRSVV